MKLRLDSSRCVGHGRCYVLAPEVFSEDDRGHCVLVSEQVAPGHESQARLGVDNCPEEALSLDDD